MSEQSETSFRSRDIKNFLEWASYQSGRSSPPVREEGFSFGQWVSIYGQSHFECPEDDQLDALISQYLKENPR